MNVGSLFSGIGGLDKGLSDVDSRFHQKRGHLLDLTELEQDARRRAQQLENRGLLPQGYVAHHHPPTLGELREYRRLKACLALATDADTFVALVKKRPVAASRLDQAALAELRHLLL